MKKEITLTEAELEATKDAVAFRTTCLLQLKQLNGIPDRVTKIESRCGICQAVGASVILSIMGIAVFCVQKVIGK
jgi:hypothetical protein